MLFTKKIQNEFEEGVLCQQKIKVKKIKLGSKLIVGQNQVAFVCDGKKVLDMFSEGEFDLNGGCLPKTFKEFDLNKPKKHKVSQELYNVDYFNACIVILNLQHYSKIKFETCNFLVFDEFCDTKMKMDGRFDFEIVDKLRFAEFVAKYKKGNADVMAHLRKFVSKKIRYEFHKEEMPVSEFLSKNNAFLYAHVEKKLTKRLDKIGIKLSNFDVENLAITKRSQKVLNELIAEGKIILHYQNVTNNNNEVEDVRSEQCIQDF